MHITMCCNIPSRNHHTSYLVRLLCVGSSLTERLTPLAKPSQLDNVTAGSWWMVFTPTWANHALHIPLQIYVLLSAVSAALNG